MISKGGKMLNTDSKFDHYVVNSRLSFLPLINMLKKSIAGVKPGAQRLYGDLIAKFENTPELLQPFSETSSLEHHEEMVQTLLATLFPSVSSEHDNLYAVGFPFRFNVIYSSPLFQANFLKPGTNEINVPDDIFHALVRNRLNFAYCHILKNISNILQTIFPVQFTPIPILQQALPDILNYTLTRDSLM
jgi:hypothetical protein